MRSDYIFKLLIIVLIGFVLLIGGINYPQKEDIIITLSGELSSENPTYIKVPGNWNLTYQIVYLPEEGEWVEKGDTVVIFDTKEVDKKLDEVLQNSEQQEKKLIETKLRNQQTISDIENQMKILNIQKKITINKLEQSKYNSVDRQQHADLELKKVEVNIIKIDQSMKSQIILNTNSENELILGIEQSHSRINDYKKILKAMFIVAPKAGIIVYHKTGTVKVKIGDTIRPRRTVLQIPDLNNMLVKIDLNEVDLSKIKLNQKANFEVLAYPDSVFSGKVIFISKIADENKDSNLRIYPIDIKVQGQKNYRLKPGLTVKLDLIIDNLMESFSIPSYCLFFEQGKFFVKTKSKVISVEIVKIYDGKAFIKGLLNTEMQLIENNNIPNY